MKLNSVNPKHIHSYHYNYYHVYCETVFRIARNIFQDAN